MALPSQQFASGKVFTRRLLAVAAFVLAVWVLFFDSHSIHKRIEWHREVNEMVRENRELEDKIERLVEDLEQASSPEMIEKIAREQYGMRKPGETVYPVERD